MITFGEVVDAAKGLGTAHRNRLEEYADKDAEMLSWYDVTQLRGVGPKAAKAIAAAYVALGLDPDGAFADLACGKTPMAPHKIRDKGPTKTEQARLDLEDVVRQLIVMLEGKGVLSGP